MLFVTVHCDDEIDRDKFIPLHLVTEVNLNADGGDYIKTNDNIYIPRNEDSFYRSIVEINGEGGE